MASAPVQTAPSAPSMNSWDANTALAPQPEIPGNCCVCCAYCGGAPPTVDPKNILAEGGKYIQLSDGRIVEYFVYGSTDPAARVLLQINGSMGTGWAFANLPGIVNKLKELNIKGLSVTLPGHGYSTVQTNRNIADWPRDDVEPVLRQEGVPGSFMVEGSSFGTAHALAVAVHYGERVSAMHLHLPYLPLKMRTELGFALYGQDDALKCEPSYATSMASCGFCLFCCCSTMSCCHKRNPTAFHDEKTKKLEAAVPGSQQILDHDNDRSSANGVHGWVYNGFVPTIGDFPDPRHVSTQTKALVSYAEDDVQCPAEQGAWIAEHFTKNAAVCKVNKEKGLGHSQYMDRLCSGEFVEQIAAL